jgi:hypothetical protein
VCARTSTYIVTISLHYRYCFSQSTLRDHTDRSLTAFLLLMACLSVRSMSRKSARFHDVTEDEDQAPAPASKAAKAAHGRAKTAPAPASLPPAQVPPMRAAAMAEFGVLSPHPGASASVSAFPCALVVLCWSALVCAACTGLRWSALRAPGLRCVGL